MSRVTRLNVAVTATTAQFDRQMDHVRRRLKQTREGLGAAGAALGGLPGVGSLGGVLGFASLSGPLMAFTAAGTAIAAAVQRMTAAVERDKAMGQEGLAAILQDRMPMQQAAQFTQAAQLIKADAKAGDLAALLEAFKTTDPNEITKLQKAGMTDQQIAAVSTGDLGTDLMALRDLSASAIGQQVAMALGKQGELFNLLRTVEPAQIQQVGANRFQSTELIRQQMMDERARRREVLDSEPMQQSGAGRLMDDVLLGLEQMFTPDEDLFAARERAEELARQQLRALESIDRKSGGPR